MTKAPTTTASKTTKAAKTKAVTTGAAKDEAPPHGTPVEKPRTGHKPNALQQPLQPSPDLAAVVGEGTMARGAVVSKVWEYIKAHKLQNPDDGREIVADDKLRRVFGKDRVTMFEMNKHLAAHLK